MIDRFAGLAIALSKGHREVAPAPAGGSVPRAGSRLWIAVLALGAAAVYFHFMPFLDATGQALTYIGIEALAVAVVFGNLVFGTPRGGSDGRSLAPECWHSRSATSSGTG